MTYKNYKEHEALIKTNAMIKTSYILLNSMYAKLIFKNVRAINLRAVELVEICFWIPLQEKKIGKN